MYNTGYIDDNNNIYRVSQTTNQQQRPIGRFDTNFEMEADDYYSGESTKRRRIVQTVMDFVVIILIFIVFILVYFLVDPKIRYFTCNDTDIWFPYIDDTIAFWVVGIYGILGPLIIILVVELLNANFLPCQKEKENRCRSFWIAFFHAISLFVLGIALVLTLTEIGKRWVGRLRPHFMSVCDPDLTKIDCKRDVFNGFVYRAISTGGTFCRGDPDKIKEARFSFPSGHSSFSSYTMLFAIFFLEARLVLIRFRYIKTLVQLACFIAAFVTILSRISDYHHRGSDVAGGTILGVIVAVFVVFQVGRVLWIFDKKKNYHDFDLKQKYSF